MRAWIIKAFGAPSDETFSLSELPDPKPSQDEILIRVIACGVCHTDLDELEGRVRPSLLPIVPGHQIIGEIVDLGHEVKNLKKGQVVGLGWIYHTCGTCPYCSRGLENLCANFKGTGKDVNGGYAEYVLAKEDYVFTVPNVGEEIVNLAPLFCAGSIGYRALKLSELRDGETLGLIGFGASNHLLLQLVKSLFPRSTVFVFTRNPQAKELALSLGADYVGDPFETPPDALDALIDTTPSWKVPFYALRYLKPAGRLVINAISKEDSDREFLLSISYERDLWLEREIKTVANVTRADIRAFLEYALKFKIRPEVAIYPFEEALQALRDIKAHKTRGAKVIKIV